MENKNEQVEQVQREARSALQAETTNATPSKCEVIGSFIGMGMVGFCFGIGVILAVKTVNNLEYCIEELISRKC